MNENEARTLLRQLLDGELDGAAAQAAQQAVDAHPALRDELNAHLALRRALGGLRGADADAGFEDRLMARLATEPPGFWERATAALRRLAVPMTLAAAAMAAVALTVSAPTSTTSLAPEVSAAGLLPRAAPVAITLRVRAPGEAWQSIRGAMTTAGMTAPETMARAGGVASVEVMGTAEQLGRALEALGTRLPVEVQGTVPPGDAPVRVRMVLSGP